MREVLVSIEPLHVRFFGWEGERIADALYMRKIGARGWQPAKRSSIIDRIDGCIKQLVKRGYAERIQQITLNCQDAVRLFLMWDLTPEDARTMVVAPDHATLCGVYFDDRPMVIRVEKRVSPGLFVGDRTGEVVAKG